MGKRYKYVIVAGCSRFGASIASSLSLQGNDVIVIDKDKNPLESYFIIIAVLKCMAMQRMLIY
ncbi:hypothetical protein EXQ30_04555 [Clostridium botulinum]|uniref:NAD-binding protein n=1 Tax=Clostridium botulinum TaxID=1491 RepID=UPI001A91F1AB|nr:NAD-binding protein [Clostridium botulinum]MBO0541255.1 hypothetical protein [Clostridium botulinum]MBO0546755.1 hypothetical protein [Clostridium botulinum]MBO0555969.1 hypothetical protein [Clostridium botulinum]MBO0563191.1 hypothetical protein [Clostridium botulinum]